VQGLQRAKQQTQGLRPSAGKKRSTAQHFNLHTDRTTPTSGLGDLNNLVVAYAELTYEHRAHKGESVLKCIEGKSKRDTLRQEKKVTSADVVCMPVVLLPPIIPVVMRCIWLQAQRWDSQGQSIHRWG
jgi:hypothetical protein